jgi:hypothetical protein
LFPIVGENLPGLGREQQAVPKNFQVKIFETLVDGFQFLQAVETVDRLGVQGIDNAPEFHQFPGIAGKQVKPAGDILETGRRNKFIQVIGAEVDFPANPAEIPVGIVRLGDTNRVIDENSTIGTDHPEPGLQVDMPYGMPTHYMPVMFIDAVFKQGTANRYKKTVPRIGLGCACQ